MEKALLGLEKTNLREQAAVALRQAITSGALRPGTHLRETELSSQLQISRGTLREAFRELQQEGLVVQATRGRLLVRSLSPKEIEDIFVVRGALESLAAELLVSSPDLKRHVDQLGRAVERMAEAEPGSLESRVEADLAFHRLLCSLTENESLVTSWEGLEGAIRMSIMFAGIERGTRNMDIARHQAIVDAVASGDRASVREAISEHMGQAARTLIG
ncbi:GntR family transcriptional regulator [Herbiconiux sp. CPCC 203407]|uniref:GntR family transcriptional regulator n=1 Tax=Herbiconiux oxytropis TaxID=2970915 RepID=A0AA41XEU0_9MICO|nr:GntR family transcriptional regulator [Herbiconiux oxytropis]MCS5721696.1 GntR family transcriptional regulator [Herbiconiux oxytropis]MCS5726677.1 GntR family transcriptional regulator [Herbiconiux oxytropis]